MSKAIGFIGLGVMGFPMAGHLSKNHNIFVFNRSPSKSKDWVNKYQGTECKSVQEITKKSDILILCVGNDEDVRNIICDDGGVLNNAKPGLVIIDHTTTSADLPIAVSYTHLTLPTKRIV